MHCSGFGASLWQQFDGLEMPPAGSEVHLHFIRNNEPLKTDIFALLEVGWTRIPSHVTFTKCPGRQPLDSVNWQRTINLHGHFRNPGLYSL
jgi:hypothetical protein